MTTLYTKLCTIECQVFKLVCKNSKCIQVWNGSKENIFRLSRNVCIVEELCWEFTNNVCTMKCNFSSFSKSMNDIYISHQSAKKFLTSKTFLKIYFAWASHQNREFRRACYWCGESPKALACDGTKIGIMSRNLRIVPMESVSSDAQKLPTQNRRNDRCFLRYPEKDPNETIKQQEEKEKRIRDARLFLKSQTKKKVLDEKKNADKKKNKKKNELELSPEEMEDQTKFLLGVIPKELVPLFTSYFNQKMSLDQLVATKRVFYFLSFDCALRTFLPSMLLPTIESLLQANIFDDDDIESVYEECRKYNPALEAFLQSFVIDGLLDENAANLLKYICNRIRETEALNPDSTVGAHIVNGQEGRKDAACSLFTHLEIPPEMIFYDFACSLEEYTLNREAEYFRMCRFYHDLFHGPAHSCSSMFNGRGLEGMMQYNTSICEQFNSFLQCIKASGKHIIQQHFVFFTQFMIDIWNTKKYESFATKLKVALSCSKA
ncbi:uncharacterized protein [Clytia hemisphaerica]|uniref:uncharacterized protein n=1 Tax=Clytia hemisphaerica TaxID=252671 RepID=UPI0034D470E5